jgi:hypothetical protein
MVDYKFICKYVYITFLIICIFIIFSFAYTPEIELSCKPILYDDIKDNFKTGDIICFCGNMFEHFMVRFFTRCPISHVGMVYRDNDELYLFEATNRSEKDKLTGLDDRHGPVLVSLKDKLENYTNYKFIHIPLKNISPTKNIKNKKLLRVMKKLNVHMFNSDVWSWIKGICWKTKPSEGKFCSQTIIDVYNELGITDEKHPYSKIPSDFYWHSENKNKLNMINGWKFGKQQTFIV